MTNATPSFEIIETLASEFQTTLTATAIRFVQLCGQKCAIVFSTNVSEEIGTFHVREAAEEK